MKCPKCGSREIHELDVDQDIMGNYITAIVCMDCEHELMRQDYSGQCLHLTYYRDEIGRKWCSECDDYLGER